MVFYHSYRNLIKIKVTGPSPQPEWKEADLSQMEQTGMQKLKSRLPHLQLGLDSGDQTVSNNR